MNLDQAKQYARHLAYASENSWKSFCVIRLLDTDEGHVVVHSMATRATMHFVESVHGPDPQALENGWIEVHRNGNSWGTRTEVLPWNAPVPKFTPPKYSLTDPDIDFLVNRVVAKMGAHVVDTAKMTALLMKKREEFMSVAWATYDLDRHVFWHKASH